MNHWKRLRIPKRWLLPAAIRVDPAILLHCKPGDLFVIRNVAALVPAVTQASNPCSVMSAIEYGVKHLNVEHIVVMGHSHCGGIHGLMTPESIAGETYIQDWVSIASRLLNGFKL